MKKSAFFLWLLAIASGCLSACGNKDFQMSFEDALEIANHSELQEIILNTDNFQQTFDLSMNIKNDDKKAKIAFSSDSKQDLKDQKSESSINFKANISEDKDTNYDIAGNLDIKVLPEFIYLNLWSLDVKWSEDMSMITSIISWFQNQRFSIPMTGYENMQWILSYLKDNQSLSEKAKDIITNEWLVVYSGKFEEFNWYNARKIWIDNQKLSEFMKEYFVSILGNEIESEEIEFPEINIENFEWYLIITWKDKVTTAIENMDIVSDEVTTNGNALSSRDHFELNIYSNWETIMTIYAKRSRTKYKISVEISDLLTLKWKITPKISKSKINIQFNVDAKIKNLPSNEEITIPMEWSRSFQSISEFEVDSPENATDLTEMLGGLLGSMYWWELSNNYYNDIDYDNMEDLYNMDDFNEDIDNDNDLNDDQLDID